MKGDIQAEEAPMKGWLLLGALPIVRVAVPVVRVAVPAGEEGSDRLAGTVPSSIAGPRRGTHEHGELDVGPASSALRAEIQYHAIALLMGRSYPASRRRA